MRVAREPRRLAHAELVQQQERVQVPLLRRPDAAPHPRAHALALRRGHEQLLHRPCVRRHAGGV